MKKGQITLFIIVGIVILGIFMLLFSVIASVTVERLESQRERIVSGVLDTALIQRYVSACVDDALETGLRIIGSQGGMLFEGQLGGVMTPFGVSFGDSKVSFGITHRELVPPELFPCPEQFASQPPTFCRYPDTPFVTFGQIRLPQLESPLSGGSLSIQKQLERYIAAYVQRCVDIPTFQEEEGLQGYSLEEGIPVVEVRFPSAAVLASVDYPLSVQLGNEEPITHFVHFETRLPVRFRHIYGAVENILRKDTSLIDYDIRSDIIQELPFFPAFPHPLGFSYRELGPDDVLIIEDPLSVVGDKNFLFQIARQNRPPALDYIHKFESLRDIYDYLLVEDEVAHFQAHAEDPDEDPIRYEWDGNLGSGIGQTFSKLIPAAGEYLVTMKATDGSLNDLQNVRILADTKLKSSFAVDNGYRDVPDNFISIEDPFFLNAQATNRTLDKYAAYTSTWSVADAQTVNYLCSVFPGYGRCELGVYDTGNIEIDSVRDMSALPLGRLDVTLHTVLEYNGMQQSDSTARQVEVKECLPHRNAGTAPYPYNQEDASNLYPHNPETNPFQANHACCTDDFTIAGQDTACYTLEQCGHPEQTLLSRRNRFCSGDRGNVCGGDWSDNWEEINRCGYNGQNECSGVADLPDNGCQGLISYGRRIISGNELWCNGPTGCEKLGCGRVPVLGFVFGLEKGGIDTDGSGLNSLNDYCGCTEEDVNAQRECIKDEGIGSADKKGVCSEVVIIGTNYCS